jgi:large subunit ribosomal protein L4e
VTHAGKLRNRRWTMRRGPLVVYANDQGVAKAFRNLPGVDVCSVDRLNLLQLAPGGHVGRFIIWSKAAFEKLDSLWGTFAKGSELKAGYTLPKPIMANADVARIINSDEVQSVLRAAKEAPTRSNVRKNPLRNSAIMVRLNPYAVCPSVTLIVCLLFGCALNLCSALLITLLAKQLAGSDVPCARVSWVSIVVERSLTGQCSSPRPP